MVKTKIVNEQKPYGLITASQTRWYSIHTNYVYARIAAKKLADYFGTQIKIYKWDGSTPHFMENINASVS